MSSTEKYREVVVMRTVYLFEGVAITYTFPRTGKLYPELAMLQDPDMKVTDVAHLLGYSNATHFARAFRRIAGSSPRAYRRACSH